MATIEERMQYADGLIAQLVDRIEQLQGEISDYALEDGALRARWVSDELRDLLMVEAAGGQSSGTLMSVDGGWMIGGRTSEVTSVYEIGPKFKGVVWNEEMDRPPKEEEEE
jgi:hypothetical protein